MLKNCKGMFLVLLEDIKGKVLNSKAITKEEAIALLDFDLEELCKAANEIRIKFCLNNFDICTIINAKSGKCSEDCKYCAQSSHYNTQCTTYPLLAKEEVVEQAKYCASAGINRFSLVTSGKALTDKEVSSICEIAQELKPVPIKLCGSFGLLNEEQYQALYNAGIRRMHNNLETSRNYFPNMCTTHSFDDKINSIHKAKACGMYICSGCIFGIGESFTDRIDLAFSLKELHVQSIPMNLLSPIKGTPYENNTPLSIEEFRRIIAIYRFILPNAYLRLAGGRGLLEDKGKSCFTSGANATISGDFLTTTGVSIKSDLEMIKELGFEIDNKE